MFVSYSIELLCFVILVTHHVLFFIFFLVICIFISPCRRHRGTIAIDKALTTY
jgi:hypothetical protein